MSAGNLRLENVLRCLRRDDERAIMDNICRVLLELETNRNVFSGCEIYFCAMRVRLIVINSNNLASDKL